MYRELVWFTFGESVENLPVKELLVSKTLCSISNEEFQNMGSDHLV